MIKSRLYRRERAKAERFLAEVRATLNPGDEAELFDCGAFVLILRADGTIEKRRTPSRYIP